MALRLRVVSAHSRGLGETASKVFGVSGGTVGRAEDNDWVLPDPDRFISGHHVRIEYRQGEYWLADTSSNGTYINDSNTPQSEQGACALQDGDRIRMGDYEIAVTIDANNDFPPDNSAIVAFDGIATGSAQKSTEEDIGAELDLETLFGSTGNSSSRLTPVNAWGQAVESAAVSSSRRKRSEEKVEVKAPPPPPPAPVQAQPPPPAARREEPKKPADPPLEASAWHLSTRRVEPFRNPLRSGDAAGADGGDGVQSLFRGAGIDPSTLSPAVQAQAVTLAGQLLREMVVGMMDVMQTRTEVKNRFRIPDPATPSSPQNAEYNPLQFSAGVDEALKKLFEAQNKTSSRYLSPLEAVRETFHDLKTHNQAMTAAMQTAFMEFLSHLDPGELQERFDRGLKRGGLLGAATNKMKYWELYAEFFHSLSQKQDLPHLFVEEFAQAYAAKIAESRRPRSTRAS